MIWVVGAQGMLGQELANELTARGIPSLFTDRGVDFTDLEALRAYAQGKAIRWIVNAAAYTAVDKAEDEPDLCVRINAEGPKNLAVLAESLGAGLAHLSTDYVFDGHRGQPWKEDDAIGPQSVYGRSKAQGEAAVREHCSRHLILRTAWLYGAYGPNFVFTMLRLMNERDTLSVVADQWGSPTWTVDLVRVIIELLQRPSVPWGTYHVSANGVTSWHAYAERILHEARALGLVAPQKAVSVNPVTTAEYPTKARRPAWSVLDKTKIETLLGRTLPPWEQSLRCFLESYKLAKEQA